MATVQYGGGVTQITGSIGGNTFQRNTSGNTIRSRITAAFPLSSLRAVTQQQTQYLLSVWRNTPGLDQLEWNDYGRAHPRRNKFGQTKNLSGANYFVLINSNRLLCDQEILTVVPDFELPNPIGNLAINLSSSQITLTADVTTVPSTEYYILYTTAPLLGVTTTIRSKLLFTKKFEPNEDITIDLKSFWSATHGVSYPPSDNSKFAIGAMLYSILIRSGINSAGALATGAYTS